ncbi:acyl-CoA dehydrogenase family protein [Hyphomonas sp. UBA3988]|uniref:acyl-CoA dehydrogenase family protein n=1 Tax=Hyphomonas sp. UBA3988 TaxID=1946628 RepID=UPI0039C86F0D|tara:strand:+ start:82 stop:438 length:357 start_codon:yes stop_codon:yes gene_type:complete
MLAGITQKQRQAVDQFRRLAEERVRPVTDPLVHDVIPKHVALHLMREVLPFGIGSGWIEERQGGLEIGYLTSGLLYEELNRVSAEFAGIAFVNEGAASPTASKSKPRSAPRWNIRSMW